MRALVYNGGLRFEKHYPHPSVEDGEALLNVLCVGICNTDIEIMKGYMDFKGILGHEFVGVVEQCENTKWLGKRVVGEINCACGTCRLCRVGLHRHCSGRTVLGIVRRNGACADYVTLPVENLHPIPDSISDEEAVFVEPLAAAFRILEQVPITSSQKVIVVGDGKLGLLVAQVMRVTQCDLTVVGKHESKLEILDSRGITTAFAGEYRGEKADVVVECTGAPDGLETGIRFTRPEGTLVVKSTCAKKVILNMNRIVVDEITVHGSRCGPFQPAIEALSRKTITVKPLISRVMPLEMGLEAFEVATNTASLKVLLRLGP